MDKVGVVHGRFQLFHKDHLKYVLAAKQRCGHLIVGICNPEPALTAHTDVDPLRSTPSHNPFTFYERMQMVKGSLLEEGISGEDFDIVPFPINYPERIRFYAPADAKYYMSIYDGWGEEKLASLTAAGFNVEVMWRRDLAHKGISGTDVRAAIIAGKEWKQYVPDYVYRYVTENHLEERLTIE